ncbi:elongator complex protein 1 [Aplysia californica]|uniref:Elongator complex protein 1 n=1 Tax=Aplysia californica TaxID=6500 RepID=A0ABM0JEY6_APLCA|nr:elongator complex protein 1 [Aplysia californica]XP_005092173.1 elongator complex protein 1 [Aplysia californica]
MRNLRLVDSHVVEGLTAVSETLYLSVDTDVGTVYVATSESLIAFSPETKEVLSSISLQCEGGDNDCGPVGLQYLYDQQAVCVATKDGRMCLWQMNSAELECVGEVAQGLTSMSWSPDLELVVITTGNDTLIIMTREFDAITEVSIIPTDSGEENPINVGWGKKETQFHGSAGKQAAKKQTVHVSPAGPKDNRLPVVRWRGDGQFFVVSTIDPESDARFLYTWSRECTFQSRSEPIDGLQHSLFWKPSGSVIASVQTNQQMKVQDVVFFEKNGLRHGEFRIPESTDCNIFVRSLSWNQDSTVLALCFDESTEDGSQPVSVLQLWTVNNYHWYLKQTLRFTAGVCVAEWDVESFCKLNVVTRGGMYMSYTWAWTTDSSLSSSPEALASVAVIDGDKLLVSPMRTMVVPPPMAAFTLSHPVPVNSVAFNLSKGSNDLAALMSDGRISFWRYKESESPEGGKLGAAGGDGFIPKCSVPTLCAVARIVGLEQSDVPLSVSNLLWLSEQQLLFSTLDDSRLVSLIHTASFNTEENTVVVKKSFPLESHMIGICASSDVKSVIIQLSNGELLKFYPDTDSPLPFESASGSTVAFPYPCTHMAAAIVGNEEVVLGLTEKFRFYVNDVEVASNCTSFGVHNDFLLITTLTHTVRCICKTTKLSDLPKLSDGKAHPFDESIRRVERGSRIVTVVGNDTKLVLQMPRGNLETIHPRALVLSTLKHLLDSDRIQEAFMVMRKHRINMNLLYDHSPSLFLENLDQVIEQIQSVNHLNLFLTDLIEEDVTRTMYTASYQRMPELEGESDQQTQSKVDKICNAALAAFKRLDEDKYLLSIITAYVRKTTPELEQALLLVWSLHGKESTSAGVSAEQALKYLLFLVDVNTLYDVALGTYNFDLVMMVAEKSQKDPKEYIPFLNNLRRLEETYRYYTIDKHLKKYSKALEHISKCGEDHFEECVGLVSDHKLYSKALRLYTPGSAPHKHIAALYGGYLRSKNRHDEAGIMYVKAEEWELALEAFIASHEWRQVFCMAAKLEYSANRLSELAVKVAGHLKGKQRYAEAAQVFEQYAQDPEEAVAALIEGAHWNEALRVMHKYKRLDLIETHLREGLEESWEHHMEMLTAQKEQFNKYKKRLMLVRIQKEKARSIMEGAAEYNDADADLFSDTTSMTGGSVASLTSVNSSRSTVFSKATGSSRTRRKAENKKWSLKEGSVNEEYALVDALAQIIKSTEGLKEETNVLMKTLIQFNYDDKACQLQELLNGFLAQIQASVSTIWIYTPGSCSGGMSLGPNTTASAIAQAMQSGKRVQAEEEKLDPVLLVPPTLSKHLRWKLHMAGGDDEK